MKKKFNITPDESMNPELKKEIQDLRGLIWSNIPKLKNSRFEIAQLSDRPAVLIRDSQTGYITQPIGLCNLRGAIQVLNELNF